MVRGFLDSGYKVSKWILSPHHDIAIEHGPEKHPKLLFFGESWFSMMKGQILYVWICSILLRFLISGRYQTRLDSFNWHTHTCLSLLQGTLERRHNRTVSVNICQMSIFPLPLQLKGANLPHNFLSRHGGFELARCRFSSKSAHHYCLGKQLFSNTLRILSR